MKNPFAAIIKDLRDLVPVPRRRSHLLLLLRAGAEMPWVRAVVRPEDQPHLRPLVATLVRNGRAPAELRLAKAEDGATDLDLLWRCGERLPSEWEAP